MLKQLAAGVTVAIILTGAAMAGPLQDGMAAYSRGEYEEALRLWKQLADDGLAAAQYNLGVMYATGRGVPRDFSEAIKWYQMAADQGNASGQFNLGLIYASGQELGQTEKSVRNSIDALRRSGEPVWSNWIKILGIIRKAIPD